MSSAAPQTPPAPQTVQATARFVRTSARKARLVADLLRGKPVADAQAILAYSTRAAAVPVRKVLQSAIANADHNHGLDARDLVVARVTVDEGPTIKRYRPRAMGRATSIHKRTCHITIGLAETES
jgi:large subunit ribosomal protein L22